MEISRDPIKKNTPITPRESIGLIFPATLLHCMQSHWSGEAKTKLPVDRDSHFGENSLRVKLQNVIIACLVGTKKNWCNEISSQIEHCNTNRVHELTEIHSEDGLCRRKNRLGSYSNQKMRFLQSCRLSRKTHKGTFRFHAKIVTPTSSNDIYRISRRWMHRVRLLDYNVDP